MAKSKTYRNRIDALLGITLGDVDDIRRNSRKYQRQQRLLARRAAIRARKEAA
jgi:hypothetical protein